MRDSMSYHDLHIETEQIKRTSLFDLPYSLRVTCTRVGGWELWSEGTLLAGEYDGNGLCLDVGRAMLVDSLHAPVDTDRNSIRLRALEEAVNLACIYCRNSRPFTNDIKRFHTRHDDLLPGIACSSAEIRDLLEAETP